MDVDLWMKKAAISIDQKVEIGMRFEAKDLFEPVEWTELSKGERIHFGRNFSNAVKEGRFPSIERITKGDNNHARYVKVREVK